MFVLKKTKPWNSKEVYELGKVLYLLYIQECFYKYLMLYLKGENDLLLYN